MAAVPHVNGTLLLANQGESATYYPQGGSSTTIKIIYGITSQEIQDKPDGRYRVSISNAIIDATVITSINPLDTIKDSANRIWMIEDANLDKTSNLYELSLRSEELITKHRRAVT